MSPDAIAGLAREAILLAVTMSGPLVAVAALVGLVMGLLQALTQLQDQSTSFALKSVAVFGLLLVLMPWLSTGIHNFAERMFSLLADVR